MTNGMLTNTFSKQMKTSPKSVWLHYYNKSGPNYKTQGYLMPALHKLSLWNILKKSTIPKKGLWLPKRAITTWQLTKSHCQCKCTRLCSLLDMDLPSMIFMILLMHLSIGTLMSVSQHIPISKTCDSRIVASSQRTY